MPVPRRDAEAGRGPRPPESTQAPAPSAWLLSTASVTGLTSGASSTGPQGTVTAVLHTTRPLVTPATTPRGAGRCSDPCRAPHVSGGFRARALPAGHFLSSGASVRWVTGSPTCGREARRPWPGAGAGFPLSRGPWKKGGLRGRRAQGAPLLPGALSAGRGGPERLRSEPRSVSWPRRVPAASESSLGLNTSLNQQVAWHLAVRKHEAGARAA